jgi:hypothetical protein
MTVNLSKLSPTALSAAMHGGTDGEVAYYRYVTHSRRASYEAVGWLPTAVLEGHHGYWSVLMMWDGDGEPQEPSK